METIDLMRSRHSVRQYLNKPIEKEKKEILNNTANFINQKTGLNIKMFYDEPSVFKSILAHYGKFKNVTNYIVLAGNKNSEEELGYYGETLVLTAQELGLNTCWTALTYNKSNIKINLGKQEKVHCVIALGYGETQGVQRKSKTDDQVLKLIGDKPSYLDEAVEACLLAPTAMNQQKFKFELKSSKDVLLKTTGIGPCTKIDLGIVKYHFELGAGKENFNWVN